MLMPPGLRSPAPGIVLRVGVIAVVNNPLWVVPLADMTTKWDVSRITRKKAFSSLS